MIFGQIASNAQYYTGIALVNFTSADAMVHIEAFGSDGELLASVPFAIPAGRRMSQLLTQYFPGLRNREIGSGYIRVTSDRGLAGFALFGTHRGTVLAAVPPQAVP